MTLVDGPTEESDNLICVAYRHQFDVVNESTGEAFRLHHVEASRVSGRPQGSGPSGSARGGVLCPRDAIVRISSQRQASCPVGVTCRTAWLCHGPLPSLQVKMFNLA